MAKALLIAEKPDLMRKVQEAYRKNNIPLQIDFASFAGHTVELLSPDDYTEDWKKWRIETLPMIPQEFKYKPSASKKQMYKELKDKISKGNYDFLINCCDPGREGQHIFHSFYETIGCKLPVKRMWFSDLTETELVKALNNLRDDFADAKLYNMTQASKLRSQFDWLVGMNFTRAFSIVGNEKVNIGRVMTPTLRIIVDRELEIQNFVPRDYWEVDALFDNYKGTYIDDEGVVKFDAEAKAQEFINNLASTGTVVSVEEKKETKQAPRLHSLADLQNEANKVYGYTMSETLAIVQELYEKKKILSYPRTDSSYITSGEAKKFPKMLEAIKDVPEVAPFISAVLSDTQKIAETQKNKRYVDDKKVSDHYAIVPTGESFNYNSLTKKEQHIVSLVAKRLVAIFMPAFVQNKTVVLTQVGNYLFKSNGSVLVDRGYSALYKAVSNDNELPKLVKGQQVNVKNGELNKKTTTPPSRYTDETLNKAMENAGRFVEDEALKDVLKTSKGLGTPATRGSIVDKVVNLKMIERKKKAFYATEYGVKVIQNLNNHRITSPELTGEWEGKLLEIEDCKLEPSQFVAEMHQFIHQATKELLEMNVQISNKPRNEVKVIGKCPCCGADLLSTQKYFICSEYKKTCQFVVAKDTYGATVTEEMMAKILNGEKTEILNFNIKGKKSRGSLYYHQEEKRVRIEFAQAELTPIGTCPCCQGEVVETDKYYICRNYKKTCNFVIGKTTHGAKVSKKEAQTILTGGETKVLNFKFDNGNKGSGKLYFDTNEKRVKIKFENSNSRIVGTCPCCGGTVKASDKYVTCENYKKSCDFVFFAQPFEVKLTDEEISLILNGGLTEVKELKYKSGKTGKGQLYYDANEKGLKIKFAGGKENLGKCPRCNQSDVYEGKNYYLCKHYKNPCTFIMAKTHQEQNVTPEMVKRLLQGEEVSLDWTAPNGEDYTDILYFDEGYLKVRR